MLRALGSLFVCFLASTCKQLDHIIRGHARSANSKQTLQYHLKRSRKGKELIQTSKGLLGIPMPSLSSYGTRGRITYRSLAYGNIKYTTFFPFREKNMTNWYLETYQECFYDIENKNIFLFIS